MVRFMRKAFVTSLTISLLALGMVAVVAPEPALAGTAEQSIRQGLDATGGGGGPTIEDALKVALSLLSLVAGVAAVIMIIVSGIRYITSGGDASGVKGAKEAIIYAIVGIVIVALSQAIVNLILDRL